MNDEDAVANEQLLLAAAVTLVVLSLGSATVLSKSGHGDMSKFLVNRLFPISVAMLAAVVTTIWLVRKEVDVKELSRKTIPSGKVYFEKISQQVSSMDPMEAGTVVVSTVTSLLAAEPLFSFIKGLWYIRKYLDAQIQSLENLRETLDLLNRSACKTICDRRKIGLLLEQVEEEKVKMTGLKVSSGWYDFLKRFFALLWEFFPDAQPLKQAKNNTIEQLRQLDKKELEELGKIQRKLSVELNTSFLDGFMQGFHDQPIEKELADNFAKTWAETGKNGQNGLEEWIQYSVFNKERSELKRKLIRGIEALCIEGYEKETNKKLRRDSVKKHFAAKLRANNIYRFLQNAQTVCLVMDRAHALYVAGMDWEKGKSIDRSYVSLVEFFSDVYDEKDYSEYYEDPNNPERSEKLRKTFEKMCKRMKFLKKEYLATVKSRRVSPRLR